MTTTDHDFDTELDREGGVGNDDLRGEAALLDGGRGNGIDDDARAEMRPQTSSADAFSQWAITLYAGGHLPRVAAKWVHGRIARDEDWEASYDVIRRAEHAASRTPHLDGDSHAFMLDEVLAAIPKERRSLALPALVAAGACAVALMVVTGPSDDVMTARGVGEGALGVTMRCIEHAGDTVVVRDEAVGARGAEGNLSCPHGGLLSFAVTNLQGADRHVFVVGVNDAGDVRWYAPFSPLSSSVVLNDGSVNAPLSVLADTAEMPADDKVTLFALFSSTEMNGASIARLLDGARRRGVALGKVARLPVPDVEQTRVILRLPKRASTR